MMILTNEEKQMMLDFLEALKSNTGWMDAFTENQDDICFSIIEKLYIFTQDLDFETSVEPAIRYLLNNHNPHTKIIIDYDVAELLEGSKNHNLTDEVPD